MCCRAFLYISNTAQGILTKLRDRTTSRGDFIFFVDRLATYLVEKAMEQLPTKTKTVTTPVEVQYVGKELDVNVSAPTRTAAAIERSRFPQLCGVTILRS